MKFALRPVSALTLILSVVAAIGARAPTTILRRSRRRPAPTPDPTPVRRRPTRARGPTPPRTGTRASAPNTLNFAPGQEQQLLDAVNSLTSGANVVLAAGTFTFAKAITIRHAEWR